MDLKSLIMIALITALFACPFTNAFVSEYLAGNHTGELEESKKENTVIDEGTFIAAYSEPENTFGEGILDISGRDAAFNTVESSGEKTMDMAEGFVAGEESAMLAAAQGKNDTSKRYDANNYDSNIAGNTNGKKEADNNNTSPLAGNGNGGIDASKTSAASSQSADSKASTAPSQQAGSNASTAPSQSADSKVSTVPSQPAGSNASTAPSQQTARLQQHQVSQQTVRLLQHPASQQAAMLLQHPANRFLIMSILARTAAGIMALQLAAALNMEKPIGIILLSTKTIR